MFSGKISFWNMIGNGTMTMKYVVKDVNYDVVLTKALIQCDENYLAEKYMMTRKLSF